MYKTISDVKRIKKYIECPGSLSLRGDSLETLYCETRGGNPAPKVVWFLDNLELESDQGSYSYKYFIIHINNFILFNILENKYLADKAVILYVTYL